MVYPLSFEEKTGFDNIRQILRSYILCDAGSQELDKMQFQTDFETVRSALLLTNDMVFFLRNSIFFPSQDYHDLRPELIRINTPGTFIEPELMILLKSSLSAIAEIRRVIHSQPSGSAEMLKQLMPTSGIEKEVIGSINRIMDDKGTIRDDASENLRNIRTKLARKHSETERKINSILQQAKREGFASPDSEITLRSGRMVIPVTVAYKRKISGFIHDESASGQTVYIEPSEIFEINNQIRELESAEKREIIRILTLFTESLRPSLGILAEYYHLLGKIDFNRAKAKLAILLNAIVPHLENRSCIRWIDAVHPLLFLSFRNQKKKVVPLSLDIDQNKRILVISGPNAGGKSVALKTAGLLQYMLQSGLMIPVGEGSRSGIFSEIFIDIGDEQSLEQDLSTYTSHLINLKYFVENAGSQTLILIDEFGSGTEPQLGGAIAEATLETLASAGCLGVITTHYANLKEAAGKIPGIINGAMLFDPATLNPLFRLKTGKPGSSFAFEIAEKIGFPKTILERATLKTGRVSIDYDRLLQDLESDKERLAEKERAFKAADALLSELIDKYSNLLSKLETERKAILKKSKEEAIEIIRKSNQLIEETVKKIRESDAEKETVKQSRCELQQWKKSLEAEEKATNIQNTGALQIDPKPQIELGRIARIKDLLTVGRVVETKQGEATLEAGNVILRVHPDKLEILPDDTPINNLANIPATRFRYMDISDKVANFRITLDLRGKKAAEALGLLTRHIDDSIILNIPEITVIHGKGDGVLRQVVRDYLKTVREIKHTFEGHPDRGGTGITIISFRD
ncbi:MAG TPA: Smr/MutS family protein [Bacteroidales bacterium]|nr:Smr/MutS family protein [Bacteroidales bacterium]